MHKQESGVISQRSGLATRIAVFLITLSGLILEVGLTRIYSASIWYHFAFVAISVALLGWGLGGFTVHLLKTGVRGKGKGGREPEAGARAARANENVINDAAVSPSPNLFPKEEGESRAALSINAAALVTLFYAGTIPLCLWLLVRYPFDMDRLPLYFLAPLLPFFLAGMALSIVFDIHRAMAGTLYFYDLIGAALGAVLVTLLLHLLGGEAALLAASVAPFVAALLMSLSPASRARDNEKELSGVSPSPNPLPEGEGSKNNAPGHSMSRLQRDDGPASRARENKEEEG